MKPKVVFLKELEKYNRHKESLLKAASAAAAGESSS